MLRGELREEIARLLNSFKKFLEDHECSVKSVALLLQTEVIFSIPELDQRTAAQLAAGYEVLERAAQVLQTDLISITMSGQREIVYLKKVADLSIGGRDVPVILVCHVASDRYPPGAYIPSAYMRIKDKLERRLKEIEKEIASLMQVETV